MSVNYTDAAQRAILETVERLLLGGKGFLRRSSGPIIFSWPLEGMTIREVSIDDGSKALALLIPAPRQVSLGPRKSTIAFFGRSGQPVVAFVHPWELLAPDGSEPYLAVV